MFGSNVRTLKTSEVEFAYKEHGKSDGVVVFFLHGFPDGPSTFDDVIGKLSPARRGFRFIVPWLRGYGGTLVRSDNYVSGEVAAMASDIFALADGLGVRRFGIVGHDWGARAGYSACVLEPERILGHFALSSLHTSRSQGELPMAQIQAYWYQWFFQTGQGEYSLAHSTEDLCRHIWKAWSPHWDFSRGEFNEAAKGWKNPQFVRTVLHAYRHVWGNALGRPAYTHLQAELDRSPTPKISTPTVFAYGTDDHCNLPEYSLTQRSSFTGPYDRVPVKGAGHFPQREDPKTVAKLLDKWLGSLK